MYLVKLSVFFAEFFIFLFMFFILSRVTIILRTEKIKFLKSQLLKAILSTMKRFDVILPIGELSKPRQHMFLRQKKYDRMGRCEGFGETARKKLEGWKDGGRKKRGDAGDASSRLHRALGFHLMYRI